tara:strand:- start:448 stop:648 length:201 start_codon:yes stop_codon:yes gene_type:complete
MNYSDVRSMPVTYRKWFLRRLSDEFKSQAEAQKKGSQSSDSNRPQSQQVPVDEIMERMHTESFKKF